MKIVIYQIVPEQDSKQLIYRNLEAFQKICPDRFPSELYEPVFDGEVDAADLEEVYYIFNMAHPEGYRGRSLSVSDVVEIQTPEGSSFYFCDSIGFKPIEFQNEGRTEQ